MKALAHTVMHIQLHVSFIKLVFSNVAKQRLLKMISSEFSDDYDVLLKSEHRIFKFLKVLIKRSIAI